MTDLVWNMTNMFCALAERAKLTATAKSSSFFFYILQELSLSPHLTIIVITAVITEGYASFVFHREAKGIKDPK